MSLSSQPCKSASSMQVAALLLAAGTSTRAGSSNKLLCQHKLRPLLTWVVDALQCSSVQQIIAITGHQRELIEPLLLQQQLYCVHNPDYQSGMASSLITGVNAAMAYDAILVCLGDMPHIAADLIDRLIAAASEHPDKNLLVPSYRGQRGHPVLIRQPLFPLLLELEGDRGARTLFSRCSEQLLELEVETRAVIKDYDTPDELAQWRGGHSDTGQSEL